MVDINNDNNYDVDWKMEVWHQTELMAAIEHYNRHLDNLMKQEMLNDQQDRRWYRSDLIKRVKRIVVFYLISTWVIVYLKMMIHDVISDITLWIILGTTTITVLWLPKIILQGLFDVKYPSISSDKSNEK